MSLVAYFSHSELLEYHFSNASGHLHSHVSALVIVFNKVSHAQPRRSWDSDWRVRLDFPGKSAD
jgi:hypothetical protein